MADSQISLTVSLVMIALFTVAIISFSVGFADDNSSEMNIADDVGLSNLNTKTKENLTTFEEETSKTYISLTKSTIEPGSDVFESTGTFSITWLNVFGVTKNIFKVGYVKIFGSDSGFAIFITAFLGIIGFMASLYIWKTIRGNP